MNYFPKNRKNQKHVLQNLTWLLIENLWAIPNLQIILDIVDKEYFDVFRTLNPTVIGYTNQMNIESGVSRARIDYFMCNAALISKLSNCSIEYFTHGVNSSHFPTYVSLALTVFPLIKAYACIDNF